MGNVHTNFSLIVYIFPRKIFLISMRKETGKLSEKIRQIQKGNKEEIVEVINQFDPLIKKYQRSSTKYLEERLKLTVNREKSRTVSVFAIRNFKFLGFALGRNGKGIYVRVHPKSWKKFKSRLKELSSRKRCQSIKPSLEKIKVYARGWLNYYGIASMKNNIDDINGWLYHRIRMYIWKQWKKPRTKYKNLVKLGIPEHYAATIANSRRKYWYISNNKAVIWALNKERLINSGFYDLATAYQSVHVNY
jgi:RNA-directed DNA polymerase